MLCYTVVLFLLVQFIKSDTDSVNYDSFIALQKLYTDTINAHQTFIHNWNDATQTMNKEGISNNIKGDKGGRFLQVKLQGPVNIENIREGLYDTQSKRDPPAAKIFIDEKEDLNKLYHDAEDYKLFSDDSDWDSFQENLHKLYRNV